MRVCFCPKGFALGPNRLLLHLVVICCLCHRGSEDDNPLLVIVRSFDQI